MMQHNWDTPRTEVGKNPRIAYRTCTKCGTRISNTGLIINKKESVFPMRLIPQAMNNYRVNEECINDITEEPYKTRTR